MITFGRSAGDLAAAIQIICHIINAFDRAKGSKKQYAASCAFFRAFGPVLERVKLQIEATESGKLQNDMLIQAEVIINAYTGFEAYLDKRHGLSARRPSDVSHVVATIKWSFDELHDKVQKLQEKIINAVQLFQTLIIQEIQSQVNCIAGDMAASRQSGAQREELLKSVTATLAKINIQNEVLEQASSDYQSSLDEQRNEQDQTAKATLAEIAEISESQKQLARSLAELTECIEKQRQQAESQTEAAQWQEVAVQAEEQTSTSRKGSTEDATGARQHQEHPARWERTGRERTTRPSCNEDSRRTATHWRLWTSQRQALWVETEASRVLLTSEARLETTGCERSPSSAHSRSQTTKETCRPTYRTTSTPTAA